MNMIYLIAAAGVSSFVSLALAIYGVYFKDGGVRAAHPASTSKVSAADQSAGMP